MLYVDGYEGLDVFGLDTTKQIIPKNIHADVQIRLDLDGDDNWNNNRKSVVIIDTFL